MCVPCVSQVVCVTSCVCIISFKLVEQCFVAGVRESAHAKLEARTVPPKLSPGHYSLVNRQLFFTEICYGISDKGDI